jgi:ATP-binding cassette subfamily F protein uup
MSQMTLRNLRHAFGSDPLFEGANLTIKQGEKLCLIGRNGMGKSTLMKIISGAVQADSGDREIAPELVISQLAQEIPHDFTGTVFDIVAGGLGEIGQLLSQYEHVVERLEKEPNLMSELTRLQQKIDQQDGWVINQKVEKVISLLSLDAHAIAAELSGGLRRRVLLAKALVTEPDVLLLDEPTNHLDIDAIKWLETFLQNFKKTIIFVSHDRAFMQALATRIVEIDHGKLTAWDGRYQDFLQYKEEQLEIQQRHNELFDKKLAQEEVWIRQGIKARRTRNEGRVRALEAMRKERAARRVRQGQAKIATQVGEGSARVVFDLHKIFYSYEGQAIVKGFSSRIMRGDKIGIIGPNGSGKTTLLQLILGDLQPEQGSIKQGQSIQIAYFDQYRNQLDENASVRENVCEGSDTLMINGKAVHVITYLKNFLFSPDRINSPVKALSGGERNRLLLAKLFTKEANVLVLDEPTNDLDVETLELLEEQLVNYQGTILLVSHDRQFLDHVATSTFVLEGEGVISEYVGGYEDWQRQTGGASLTPNKTKEIKKEKTEKKEKQAKAEEASSKKKLSYNEQRELKQLPNKIAKLEEKIKQLHEQTAQADFYQQEQEKVTKVLQELASLEKELEAAFDRWEELDS